MNTRLFIILAVFTLLGVHAVAQQTNTDNDTLLNGSVIEVIQSYKPKIKQSLKPEWLPQLPPADTTRLAINYNVPQQTLYYSYSSQPIHPLALGKDSARIPYQNYIKAGAGNLSTLYLDAGIGSIHSDNYESAIHLHYISQKGEITNQQYSLTGMEAAGTLHTNKYDWHAGLDVENFQYYFYGYDNSISSYDSDGIKQDRTTICMYADMKNKHSPNEKWEYDPKLVASYFIGSYPTAIAPVEVSINFNAPVSYKINDLLKAQMTLNGAGTNCTVANNFSQYVINNNNYDNSFLAIYPGFIYSENNIIAHAFLGIEEGNGIGHLLPDFEIAYHIPNTMMSINSGLLGTFRQNTYQQLTTDNPYLVFYSPKQQDKNELFVNLSGNSLKHLYYSARLSWVNYNNLPAYLNNWATFYYFSKNKEFFTLYDNVSAITLQGDARYVMDNTWSAGLSCNLYKFNSGSLSHVWGQPNTKIKGDLSYKILPELSVTGYLSLIGGINALDKNNHDTKLAPITDLGGNVEYSFLKNLSSFLQLNNLLNNKNTAYYGYSAYGINIYVGIRLKF